MKFRFKLEHLLRTRRLEENQKRMILAEHAENLRMQNSILQEMETSIKDAHLNSQDRIQVQENPSRDLDQINHFIKNQNLRIVQQKQKIAECQKLVESHAEILRQASVDRKIIEKLKDKKLAEYEQLKIRAEQEHADEQAILRHRSIWESSE